MMPPSTKIVEATRVVAQGAAGESSSPPPPLIKLSALGAPWLVIPLIQRVLIFFDADSGGQELPSFASMAASLRASLASTLARFPPLAGRIVFLPDTGDAAIDCSEEALARGARFVVAESEGADAVRLAGDADHDVGAFKQLVPELETSALPAEVLAAQVTRLRGGVAVGVAMHHAVVDGRSVWRFLEAWAAACRGDDAVAAAVFDRSAVALPSGEELARSTLRKYTPDLPLVAQAEWPFTPNLPRRTFTVTAQQMRHLKHHIVTNHTSSSLSAAQTAAAPLSSFVAIAALAWASFVRSKHPAAISTDHDVYLFVYVDCRGRRGIDPPVSEDYFGTCITGCLAKATARDLLAEDGVSAAAAAVQEEVRRAAEDPLALWDWLGVALALPWERLVSMNGSTRFLAYEATDFGWGTPSRTELVTMNRSGQVVIVAAKGGGDLQASVCVEPKHMEEFSSHFLSRLD